MTWKSRVFHITLIINLARCFSQFLMIRSVTDIDRKGTSSEILGNVPNTRGCDVFPVSRRFFFQTEPSRMLTLRLMALALLIGTVVSEKRQGVFGLCQGWGAGCTSYHSYRPHPQPPSRKITRNVHKTPTYMFTSGEYKQMLRRSATFNYVTYLLSN